MIEDQPPPVPNASRPIAELVIEDMHERLRVGIERYGTPLQPFNGRDPLVDLYQELLDAVQYVRQDIEERRARPNDVAAAVLARLDKTVKPLAPSSMRLSEFERGHLDGWNKAVASVRRWMEESHFGGSHGEG